MLNMSVLFSISFAANFKVEFKDLSFLFTYLLIVASKSWTDYLFKLLSSAKFILFLSSNFLLLILTLESIFNKEPLFEGKFSISFIWLLRILISPILVFWISLSYDTLSFFSFISSSSVYIIDFYLLWI